MNMKLYEITGAIVQVFEMLENEIIDEQTQKDTIESLKIELENKSNNIIRYIQSTEAQTEIITNEIKRLQELKKIREKTIENLKKYIVVCMESLDKKKIEMDLGTLSLRKSESVEITNANIIPQLFKTTVIEEKIDKTAIKNAIKSGVQIEGAYIATKQNLQIK